SGDKSADDRIVFSRFLVDQGGNDINTSPAFTDIFSGDFWSCRGDSATEVSVVDAPVISAIDQSVAFVEFDRDYLFVFFDVLVGAVKIFVRKITSNRLVGIRIDDRQYVGRRFSLAKVQFAVAVKVEISYDYGSVITADE